MMRFGLWVALFALVCPIAASAADCTPASIGVDISAADTLVLVYECRGMSQGFQADDTLISAITVWDPPHAYVNYQERYLFVSGVNAGGTADPGQLIYGPDTLVVPVADSVHAIPYRWDFDPPLALPRRGPFAFVIMAWEYGLFGLSSATGDPYPDGILCRTFPVPDCSVPGGAAVCGMWEGQDLCFRIEFCHDLAVQARTSTWGKLKTLYR